MKWKIILFCYFFSLVVLAQAPEASHQEKDRFALQARVLQGFSFSGFEGTGFSFSYSLNDHLKLRLGVDNTITERDSLLKGLNHYGDLHYTSSRKYDIDQYSYNIFFQAFYYFPVSEEVHFYLGGGPYYQEASTEAKYKKTFDEQVRNGSATSELAKMYGIKAIYGVEWFIMDYLSFHAEYNVLLRKTDYSFGAKWFDDGVLSKEALEQKDVWQASAGSFVFGISIYF